MILSTVHWPDWFKDAKSGHIGNYSCWRYFNVPKKCTRVNGPIAPGVLKPHVLFGPGDSIDILDLRFRRLEFQTVLVPRFFQKHFFFFFFEILTIIIPYPWARYRCQYHGDGRNGIDAPIAGNRTSAHAEAGNCYTKPDGADKKYQPHEITQPWTVTNPSTMSSWRYYSPVIYIIDILNFLFACL